MTHEERAKRRAAITDMVGGGVSLSETARRFGVSIPTVRQALGPGYLKGHAKSLDIVAALLNTDKTMADIARELHVETARVARVYHACLTAGIAVNVRHRGRPRKS